MINEQTGLSETIHPFYNVAEVQQKNINALRLNGHNTAVHRVPLGGNLTLDFYSRLNRHDELVVLFHGANSLERNFYPRFERVQTLRNNVQPFIAFADPTLMLDPTLNTRLSWYLGGPGWDPMNSISKVIRKAVGRTGSKHIVFVGGSGGGYAALRASSMYPGSLAFVQAPQTNVAKYIPTVVSAYFETAWKGWSPSQLMAAFPERFDMVRHYRERRPENYIYYMQSRQDPEHVQNHYIPFRDIHGVSGPDGIDSGGRRYFALYEAEVPGHGTVTSREFNHHYGEALEFWRSSR